MVYTCYEVSHVNCIAYYDMYLRSCSTTDNLHVIVKDYVMVVMIMNNNMIIWHAYNFEAMRVGIS